MTVPEVVPSLLTVPVSCDDLLVLMPVVPAGDIDSVAVVPRLLYVVPEGAYPDLLLLSELVDAPLDIVL